MVARVPKKAATSRPAPKLVDTVTENPSSEPADDADAIQDIAIGTLHVKMRKVTEDQFMILIKHARLAEKTGAAAAAIRANEVFFRILEDVVVDPLDIERLDDGLASRTVTVKQIADAMRTSNPDANDDSPPPARTRRGR